MITIFLFNNNTSANYDTYDVCDKNAGCDPDRGDSGFAVGPIQGQRELPVDIQEDSSEYGHIAIRDQSIGDWVHYNFLRDQERVYFFVDKTQSEISQQRARGI